MNQRFNLICDICGAEFEAPSRMFDYCPDCRGLHSIPEKKEEKKSNPNDKLLEEVREATKQGLSYGNYKGRHTGGKNKRFSAPAFPDSSFKNLTCTMYETEAENESKD